MTVTRHNPNVPRMPSPSDAARPRGLNGAAAAPPVATKPEDTGGRGCASSQELRAALNVIRAAVANLRDYRERLSAADHTAAVLDIEEATEQIAKELELASAIDVGAGVKRRAR